MRPTYSRVDFVDGSDAGVAAGTVVAAAVVAADVVVVVLAVMIAKGMMMMLNEVRGDVRVMSAPLEPSPQCSGWSERACVSGCGVCFVQRCSG